MVEYSFLYTIIHLFLHYFLFIINLVNDYFEPLNTNETQAEEYLKEANNKLGEENNILQTAQWNYATNITEENERLQVILHIKTCIIECYNVKLFWSL